jgi:tRNA A37 threonylcarbamoyladenosine modification protein TsaB
MRVIISIDTSDNKLVKVGLTIDPDLLGIDGKEYLLEQVPDHRKAQVVLPLTLKLLEEHKLELKDITEIQVNEGPGSFTGLRVGVAIANTLGYLLNIPINGKEVGQMVEPRYSA